jgi:NADH:ubiquinone oxidoreductase subunit E
MPKTEKIGEDVLGTEPPKTKYDKRKSELLEKAKEEVKKKKKLEEEEEKLPKLPLVEPTEGEQIFVTEAEAQAMAEVLGLTGKDKEVYVKEHYRSKPKKKKSLTG